MPESINDVRSDINTIIEKGGTEEDVNEYISAQGYDPSSFISPEFQQSQRTPIERMINQFQIGSETTEREFGSLIGAPLTKERRIAEEAPRSVSEKTANLAGEYLAPIPQLGGIPGAAFGATAIGKTISGSKGLLVAKNVATKISKNATEIAKNRLADLLKLTAGISEAATARLFDKGGKILKPEYLDDAISPENLTKAEVGLEKAFATIGDKFDEKVIPLLKKAKDKVNVTDIRDKFKSDLIAKDIIREEKGKIVSGLADTSGNLTEGVKNIISAMDQAGEYASLEIAHQLRKRIDNIVAGSDIPENVVSSGVVIDMRKNLVDNFPDAYRKVNAEFANLFKLRDDFKLATKLKAANVENQLRTLLKSGKSNFRAAIKKVDDVLPKKDKFLDNTLDELAAKEFKEVEPQSFLKLGGTAALIGSVAGPPVGVAAGALLSSPKGSSVLIRGARELGKGSDVLSKGIKEVIEELSPSVLPRSALKFRPSLNNIVYGQENETN